MFRAALSRESNKTKKAVDRGGGVRANFPSGIVLLWVIFLSVMIYVFFFSPYLFISHIEVKTSQQVSQNEVFSLVEPLLESRRFFVFPSKNFFFVPKEKIRGVLLTEYPVIREVNVERSFPQSVIVELEERDKLLLWCSGGPCVLVEGEKVWFQEKSLDSRYDTLRLSVIDTSALPFSITEPLPAGEYLHYFASLRDAFPKELGQTLLPQATTPSRFSRELRVTTNEGWALLVSIDIPLEETMLSLRAFFEKRQYEEQGPPLSLVDARVPGRIFFTEVGGVEQEIIEEVKKEDQKDEKKKDKKKER